MKRTLKHMPKKPRARRLYTHKKRRQPKTTSTKDSNHDVKKIYCPKIIEQTPLPTQLAKYSTLPPTVPIQDLEWQQLVSNHTSEIVAFVKKWQYDTHILQGC